MTTTMLDSLNNAQREAVASDAKHLLVLAGAGSGKTRILVHRTTWLINNQGFSPFSILAVTFTNKAAAEMRGRIESMLQLPTRGMWIGTFHGIAHRLLRAHWSEAGLPQHFQILDSEDQYRLVRRVLKSLNLSEKLCPPKQVQWYISGRKDAGLRPADLADDITDANSRTLLSVYEAYELACERGGLVDFAELLLRAFEVLRDNRDLLAHYQQRFRHILIDEFQDTNTLQYEWMRLLIGQQSAFTIVGDDDQSIYSWRGAQVENMQRVRDDFPDTEVVILEQNYRSTGTILAGANALIANNEDRMSKNLWTDGPQGEPIAIYSAFNEQDEASFIVGQIKSWVALGNRAYEVAILYRSNAQSRVLEEALLYASIPYRVYGGLRFFERAEIKDALAYLRLLLNRNDDSAFERVINMPTRGIGARSLDEIRELARSENIALWQAAAKVVKDQRLPARATNCIDTFLKLIDSMAEATAELSLAETLEQALFASGLLVHYRTETGEKAQARVENLEELVDATREYTPPEDTENMSPLAAFVAHAALEAGDAQAAPFQECVQLMTMHSAKGLEFPCVFIAGLEEGMFPHHLSMDDLNGMAEERRLCYVGMTRAMQKLTLTYAQTRRWQGQERYQTASRFVNEIPDELCQEVRMKSKVSRPMSASSRRGQYGGGSNYHSSAPAPAWTQSANDLGMHIGQRVRHEVFGEGIILGFEGSGSNTRVQVEFEDEGVKWLVANYANLEVSQ